MVKSLWSIKVKSKLLSNNYSGSQWLWLINARRHENSVKYKLPEEHSSELTKLFISRIISTELTLSGSIKMLSKKKDKSTYRLQLLGGNLWYYTLLDVFIVRPFFCLPNYTVCNGSIWNNNNKWCKFTKIEGCHYPHFTFIAPEYQQPWWLLSLS